MLESHSRVAGNTISCAAKRQDIIYELALLAESLQIEVLAIGRPIQHQGRSDMNVPSPLEIAALLGPIRRFKTALGRTAYGHSNYMLEIVGDAKGVMLAFSSLGSSAPQLGSVASSAAPKEWV